MNSQETKPILSVALMMALADGRNGDRVRADRVFQALRDAEALIR